MGLLRQRTDSLALRPGERAVAQGHTGARDHSIENSDLALMFLLGVFALAGAAALTIVLT